MKKIFSARLFVFIWMIIIATHASAQHFIVIQSDEKQPFTAQVNGIIFSSLDNGNLKIPNLAGGTYNLTISFKDNKYPPQDFTCVIDKRDETYTLKNSKKGWFLKNLKNNQVIASSTKPMQVAAAGIDAPKANTFAQMLAQVVDDPDLLKPTVWVLSAHVDAVSPENNSMPEETQSNDTVPYQPATTGVIKASEQTVKEGTEIVFVDFNSAGGDTIHVVIPSSEGKPGDADTSAALATNVAANGVLPAKNDSTQATQVIPVPVDPNIISIREKRAKDTSMPLPPIDTSANKQPGNPFFSKDVNTTGEKSNIATPPTAVKDSATTNPATGDNVTKAYLKTDCKRMLTDNDKEKLKHRIYLETNESKAIEQAKKFLDGKCINTAQVKELANFFPSDDGRYNFFVAVYPFVYDYGNFGALETYMIDNKYKTLFRAMLK